MASGEFFCLYAVYEQHFSVDLACFTAKRVRPETFPSRLTVIGCDRVGGVMTQPTPAQPMDPQLIALVTSIQGTLNTMANAMEAIAKHLDPKFKTARELYVEKQQSRR